MWGLGNNSVLLSLAVYVCVSSLRMPPSHAADVASNVTSTRIKFLHTFSSESSRSVRATIQAQRSAIMNSHPELVLVTSAEPVDKNDDGSELAELKKNYTFAGSSRVGFATSQWDVDHDVELNGSTWTRLTSSNDTMPDVCAVVVPDRSMDSQVLVDLATRVNKFCVSLDTVLLGFTSPLSRELAQYLEGKIPINGQYVAHAMKEFVAFAKQTNNSQLNSAASTNRLFVLFPTPACAESSFATSVVSEKLSSQRVDLCIGSNCTTCDPAPAIGEATVGDQHGSIKRGLVVLLSCGTFLVGCAFVFYCFFRKQFFMPSESTKPEKDLTTNLAYVLRM